MPKSTDLTLRQAIDDWLAVERAQKTLIEYGNKMRALLAAIDGQRALSSIEYADLVGYLASLRAHTKASGKPLKDETVAHHVQIVKSFFSWCVSVGYLRASPAFPLRVRQPRHEAGDSSKAIPPDELNRMVEYARLTSKRNYAIMMFLADTGCRVGGCAELTFNHLNLKERSAYLEEKGGRWYTVWYGEETAAALRAWLAVRPPTDHGHIWIAQGAKHAPLDRVSIAFVIRRLAEVTGASRAWGPHSIRHSVGHALAAQQVPISLIARKLGHLHASTTLEFYQPKDAEALRSLSDQYALAALGRIPGPVQAVSPPPAIPQPAEPVPQKRSARIIQFPGRPA